MKMARFLGVVAIGMLVTACGYRLVPSELFDADYWRGPMHGGTGPGETTWGPGAFASNGERIYYTGTNVADEWIDYTGGPWMGMMGGSLACASCHGPQGKGGEHVMHMQIMDAPDIRWVALQEEAEEHGLEGEGEAHAEYDLEAFRLAVVEGKHPDGDPLEDDMPRWDLSEEDLADLAAFLQTLP